MVISLESQNVKVKKNFYSSKRRPFSLGFSNLGYFKKKSKRSYTSSIYNSYEKLFVIKNENLIFVLSIFIFSLVFANCYSFFLPLHKRTMDINNIPLPIHSADVTSRKLMVNYGSKSMTSSLFNRVPLHNGETLSSISVKYGISRETILHVNGIHDVKKLLEKDSILITEVDGFIHIVQSRDTLESISKEYNVPVRDIFRVNRLKSENISDLESIFIPGVNPKDWGWYTNLNKFFIYPVNGYISKRYGFNTNSITGVTSMYEGTDFVVYSDKNVFASMGGYVSLIGYNPNYGNYIYVDHPGDTRTLYAHLGKIYVSINDKVKQGDILGLIGKSGFTSTEKLFFTLFNKDETVNPESYLK